MIATFFVRSAIAAMYVAYNVEAGNELFNRIPDGIFCPCDGDVRQPLAAMSESHVPPATLI
jgi:hypothetical protein